jgi:hypothetical protein
MDFTGQNETGENKPVKVIRNKYIPFKGFVAINLFGVLFARKECRISGRTLNHEAIHTAQMKELLYIPFYMWYVVEWLVRLIKCRDAHTAYKNISFEREAYKYEENPAYLAGRTIFNFLNYL